MPIMQGISSIHIQTQSIYNFEKSFYDLTTPFLCLAGWVVLLKGSNIRGIKGVGVIKIFIDNSKSFES